MRALAARAATLAGGDAGAAAEPGGARGQGRRGVDPPRDRALRRRAGRGGADAGPRAATRDDDVEQAAYALGSIAGRRTLERRDVGALLDARRATRPAPRPPRRSIPSGGSTISPTRGPRGSSLPDGPRSRRATPRRAFALRALEKAGVGAVPDLGRAVVDLQLAAAERAEAARALGRLGPAGPGGRRRGARPHAPGPRLLEPARSAATPSTSSSRSSTRSAEDAPRSAARSLYTLARLAPATTPAASSGGASHCGARPRRRWRARRTTRTSSRSATPTRTGRPGERARLAALLRRPTRGRAAEGVPRARGQRASEGAGGRARGDRAAPRARGRRARAARAGALGAGAGGRRDGGRRSSSTPRARPRPREDGEARRARPPRAAADGAPGDGPPRGRQRGRRALAREWREDVVETRTALLDAAVAVASRTPAPRPRARAPTRTRRSATAPAEALRALGDALALRGAPAGAARKTAPGRGRRAPRARPTPCASTFTIDGATLAIVFEPALAPIAAARFVALARAGFYDGIVVHRVVPGVRRAVRRPRRRRLRRAGGRSCVRDLPRPLRPARRRRRARRERYRLEPALRHARALSRTSTESTRASGGRRGTGAPSPRGT